MSYNPLLPPGQATMANSSPVTLASDQTDVKITLDGESIAISSMPSTTVTATNLDIRDLLFASDKVDVSGSTAVGVTGTFWQVTQPVSIAQDVMLGTDFSDVFGTASLLTTTQADNIANTTDTLNVSAFGYVFDGSTWDRLKGDSTDGMLVNLGANNDVTITGTVTASIAAAQTLATVTTVGTVTTITNVVHVDDNTGSLTIDNAQLSVVGSGTEATALRVTIATDSTGVLSIDDNGGNISIDDGGNIITVDGTVAFSNTTIAVTNAGTFVTQIDGAALTSLQLADDVVYTDDTSTHATGTSKGTGIMAVANPTDAAVDANDIGMVAMTLARALKNDITTIAGTAPTTAGFIDIKGADGNVFVRQATASNLNMTEASAASILTSVQLIDDMIYTDDTSTHATGTSKGALMMAAATPTDTAVNANDIGALAMTLNRELLVQVNTALPAGTNGIGKLTSNTGVTIGAVEIAAAQTLTTVTTVSTVTNVATIGTSITPGTGAANLGKAEDAIAGTGDTGVFILQVANEAQSSLAADGDYIASSADVKGNSMIVGNIAHDGVDAGNPVKIGAKAVSHGSNPSAVAAADRTNLIANIAGVPYSIGGHPNIVSAEYFTSGAITDDNILPAISAGTIYVITSITVTCSAANVTTPSVRIGFGTASVTAQGTTNADAVTKVVLSHPGIPAGSGITKGNGAGIIGIGGDGEELRITCTTPTTSLIVQVDYFTIAS